jgi:hypothetical protein
VTVGRFSRGGRVRRRVCRGLAVAVAVAVGVVGGGVSAGAAVVLPPGPYQQRDDTVLVWRGRSKSVFV